MKRYLLIVATAFVCTYAFMAARQAHAQVVDPVTPQLGGGAYCDPTTGACKLTWQPAGMVTVLQRNLTTGNMERVALGLGYSLVWHGSIDLGLAGYVGVGLSKDQPDAPQGDLMFQVGSIGAVGIGLESYNKPDVTQPGMSKRVYEFLFNLAINYNVGGSPAYVHKAAIHGQEEGQATARAAMAAQKGGD